MSRFSKLIDQLEELDRQDLENTAKVFSVAAELYIKLDAIVNGGLTVNEKRAIGGTLTRWDLLILKADLEEKLAAINEQLTNLD